MIQIAHDALVAFSKSFGLFYILAMAAAALAYALWPANRSRFDQTARHIVEDEDRPWR